MWNMWKGALRAAKAGRFWEKVTLVKAQSLKLNSAVQPLPFSSFRQPPKWSLEHCSWEQIWPESKLLRSQLSSGVFQSVPVAISFARLLFLSGITSAGYGSTHRLVGPIELFKFSKYQCFFSLGFDSFTQPCWDVEGPWWTFRFKQMLGTSEGLKVYAFEFECNFWNWTGHLLRKLLSFSYLRIKIVLNLNFTGKCYSKVWKWTGKLTLSLYR